MRRGSSWGARGGPQPPLNSHPPNTTPFLRWKTQGGAVFTGTQEGVHSPTLHMWIPKGKPGGGAECQWRGRLGPELQVVAERACRQRQKTLDGRMGSLREEVQTRHVWVWFRDRYWFFLKNQKLDKSPEKMSRNGWKLKPRELRSEAATTLKGGVASRQGLVLSKLRTLSAGSGLSGARPAWLPRGSRVPWGQNRRKRKGTGRLRQWVCRLWR